MSVLSAQPEQLQQRRRLLLAFATTGGVVLVNIAYEKWAAGVPDWLFILLCVLVFAVWFYWIWTHPKVKEYRRLIYNYPAMSLMLMIVVGATLGSLISALLWWSVYRQSEPVKTLDHPNPQNIEQPKTNTDEKANSIKQAQPLFDLQVRDSEPFVSTSKDFRSVSVRVAFNQPFYEEQRFRIEFQNIKENTELGSKEFASGNSMSSSHIHSFKYRYTYVVIARQFIDRPRNVELMAAGLVHSLGGVLGLEFDLIVSFPVVESKHKVTKRFVLYIDENELLQLREIKKEAN